MAGECGLGEKILWLNLPVGKTISVTSGDARGRKIETEPGKNKDVLNKSRIQVFYNILTTSRLLPSALV